MPKTTIHALGGRARAESLSQEERTEIARQGAEARNATLSKAQRVAAAKRAASARWSKKKEKPKTRPKHL